ncbi:rhomboid family intramembrane serine protease [Paenibacillus endoradicis]|uniref:rhomboid family intramembrane serine protease n=1 Tax=Paenibacillus endoradicis TaxID=2972487 RepID=UPI002159955B|nr:rhomboid family intramembrane serine protease [Paenibacillus endoradicis]MCR8659130.1 rhomboid family intramembrane serine protease [Paenibacillus endoradicis]
MIFLRYESFRGYLKSFPVTSAIVALCTLYFLFIFVMGDLTNMYGYGVFYAHPTDNPFGLDEPWRYVTSIFMHANLMHLIQNMMMLIIMAPPLERIMKSGRYLIFYLLCGIGGNFISACVNNLAGNVGIEGIHMAVGASGAIYGVLGAYLFLVVFRKKWLDPSSIRTIYWIVGSGIVFSLLYSNIDFWGHVGGLITGFVLYRLFDRIAARNRKG